MSPTGVDWLVARPIAHRGLHRPNGAVENTLSAARAAVAQDFAIECDVQLTCDGDAVVFHDFTLDRLTNQAGAVEQRSAAELAGVGFRRGADRLPTLSTLLAAIAGRVPLICEIKSRFDGNLRLADRVRAVVQTYGGPVALKSFDPAVIAYLRQRTSCPLGMIAQASYDDEEWSGLTRETRDALRALTHFSETRPDFLSYRVDDLPHAASVLFRSALHLPVVTWTVRTPDQLDKARLWADQIIFEGFSP